MWRKGKSCLWYRRDFKCCCGCPRLVFSPFDRRSWTRRRPLDASCACVCVRTTHPSSIRPEKPKNMCLKRVRATHSPKANASCIYMFHESLLSHLWIHSVCMHARACASVKTMKINVIRLSRVCRWKTNIDFRLWNWANKCPHWGFGAASNACRGGREGNWGEKETGEGNVEKP